MALKFWMRRLSRDIAGNYGWENSNQLKGPGNSSAADPMGLEPHQILAAESNGTLSGTINAGDHIKQGRLAGPVWPDEPHDLTLIYAKRDFRQDHQSTEIFDDIFQLKQHVPIVPILSSFTLPLAEPAKITKFF